ncbi:TlpA disulfide reductase family protein [Palleronia sp. LCG004]|uniref:TlpA disulfide reductase family protein n=1 Tax=Palleronia sp. LCG004 TaxID=3079304 RepID=UPI00294206BD|nr:TlpA disulfide reductase family protein [Palleronia sp. LCG004]WOI56364.1 TlpA disulfide reductase family protein [Palleronia sp. LCG004]
MKVLTTALYLGLATTANAQGPDWADLRTGEMASLIVHDTPAAASSAAFFDADGEGRTLEEYRGKYVLVNFWALWCAPCLDEMPSLDALQAELGGETFEVVPLAVWRNPMPGIEEFFEAQEIEHLPVLLDPDREVSGEMGVDALPITVLLDPEGREVARMRGDADWASEEAIALIEAVTAGD